MDKQIVVVLNFKTTTIVELNKTTSMCYVYEITYLTHTFLPFTMYMPFGNLFRLLERRTPLSV